eukprot:gnl/TRDRNA2_/TRDRNA2_177750_c0_seq8.p1 gnl/TRDRNA2_/TRDRNA2_177750_c0~~gnl/TRDRNA2_/TRDRNA2_177750_c0_seq8.p1  ORF type:complete len:173 (+),score=17.51 gnl/TRDRNA2_/TRDRNA2_177750_c0_seq8:342-860(+)
MMNFQMQNLSNTAWAFATLRCEDLPLRHAIAAAAIRKLQKSTDGSPQDTANLTWRCVATELHRRLLAGRISLWGILRTEDFDQQNIGNTAWAVARLGFVAWPLLDAISKSARTIIGEFGAQALSNTSWAFATLRIRIYGKLVDAIAAQAIRTIVDFDAQALGNTAWACACLQ